MDHYKSLCVYCGSSNNIESAFIDSAHALGKILAENDIQLVYGGGHVGLMGQIADSVLEHGGKVVGIIPGHIQEMEVAHKTLTELHVVESMHQRKQMMVDYSDGFIVLPGGLGTMDEFFEIMTWKQLGLHEKPIILVNVNSYWSSLLTLIDHMVSQGFAQDKDKKILHVIDTVQDVIQSLESAPREQRQPHTKWM